MDDDRTGVAQQRRTAGFSLIELLVVIAVLVILIALTVGLANGVLGSGRDRAAQDTIRVLDQSVEAWSTATGDKLPSMYEASNGTPLPSIDARVGPAGPMPNDDTDGDGIPDLAELPWPSLSIYIASLGSEDSASSVIRALDTAVRSTFQDNDVLSTTDDFTRVLDPWGNPIRFVHPAYDGGWGNYWDSNTTNVEARAMAASLNAIEFRRSWRPFESPGGEVPRVDGFLLFGDADEGICPGGGTRAYFYSAGPDGDPGTIEDNVYSERPQFPAETANIRE